jgi:hypothetical protein
MKFIFFLFIIVTVSGLISCDNPGYNQTYVYQKQIIFENVSHCGQDCGYGDIYPITKNISHTKYQYTCINETFTFNMILDIYAPVTELYYSDDCINFSII